MQTLHLRPPRCPEIPGAGCWVGFGRQIVLVRELVELTPVCLLDEPMMGSASLDLDDSMDAALPIVLHVTHLV